MRNPSYQLRISVNVAAGHKRKKEKNTISTTRIMAKIIISATITKVFKNIPIAIEKSTSPFLYSFFQGLKKVFISKGSDRSESKDEFRDVKNLIILNGASRYQNFRKTKGRVR